jgi:hypothetical protein
VPSRFLQRLAFGGRPPSSIPFAQQCINPSPGNLENGCRCSYRCRARISRRRACIAGSAIHCSRHRCMRRRAIRFSLSRVAIRCPALINHGVSIPPVPLQTDLTPYRGRFFCAFLGSTPLARAPTADHLPLRHGEGHCLRAARGCSLTKSMPPTDCELHLVFNDRQRFHGGP